MSKAPFHTPKSPENGSQVAFNQIVSLLKKHSKNDFSLYKPNTLYRRIERRMALHHLVKLPSYLNYLETNTQEQALLFKELLIGVTGFFRDPEVWVKLKKETLPTLIASRTSSLPLRAWVAGCSTGEEAYSLAMILKETIDQINPLEKKTVQIFATDINEDAIEKARKGLFSLKISSEISKVRLQRFFTKEARGYRICKEIREMVIFACQNLVLDPPFTKIDFLSCRNLLIYLNAESQRKLIPIFNYSLNGEGTLLLGSAETIGDQNDLFTIESSKLRIFKKSGSLPIPNQVTNTPRLKSPPELKRSRSPLEAPGPRFQSTADQLVLNRYSAPIVITNEKGDLLYTNGKIEKYLEPSAGKSNLNLFVMLRDRLWLQLEEAFQEVLRLKTVRVLHNLKTGIEGEIQRLEVTIEFLHDSGALSGFVIIQFKETLPCPPSVFKKFSKNGLPDRGTKVFEERLLRFQEDVLHTQMTMQTTQEELRSANEELQSTNEELQSTNEELTTSKEELHSVNEELQTLNTELQTKVDELSQSRSDMRNLLDSTYIATLFLDAKLKIRRFTPQTTKIIKLIPSDEGRPITDLVTILDYPDLEKDARLVLRKLTFIEKSIHDSEGSWFTVRIMPYRTIEDRVDGVVITFTNITKYKQFESLFRDKKSLSVKKEKKNS